MEKICKECGESKHYTLYPKDKRHPLGHCGRRCTNCTNKKNATKNNPVIKQDKTCSDCCTLKPWTEFPRDKKSSDGLQNICKECRNSRKRKAWHLNKEENHKKRDEYKIKNRDKVLRWKRESYYRNRDEILVKQKAYIEKNYDKRVEYSKHHYRDNKHIYIANARKREGRLNEGINNEFNDRMKEIYFVSEALSKESEIKYNVDHIVPLTHNDVCGLHVPWNLQLLTKDENQIKKNKFDGTYDNESWRVNL